MSVRHFVGSRTKQTDNQTFLCAETGTGDQIYVGHARQCLTLVWIKKNHQTPWHGSEIKISTDQTRKFLTIWNEDILWRGNLVHRSPFRPTFSCVDRSTWEMMAVDSSDLTLDSLGCLQTRGVFGQHDCTESRLWLSTRWVWPALTLCFANQSIETVELIYPRVQASHFTDQYPRTIDLAEQAGCVETTAESDRTLIDSVRNQYLLLF